MLGTSSSADHALLQDSAFHAALRLCGQTPVRLPRGQLILHRWVCGVPIAMLPRSAPPEDLAQQLQLRGLARTPLILSPDVPCPLPGALRLRRPMERAVWRLHQTEDVARAGLHQKWRNQLKRAELGATAVTCAPLDPERDARTLRLAQEQALKRGYVNWPSALTAAFAKVAPAQTHLLTAHVGGRPVAQMLFLTHGKHATYHIGHTTNAGRQRCAHNLLLWKGARHLAGLGFETLDLGLLDHRNSGLSRFKLRTGAQRQPTGGTWLYWRPFAARHPVPSVA